MEMQQFYYDNKIVKKFIHATIAFGVVGMIVGLIALFTCPVLMAECFCLALVFITIDRYYEIKDEKNGNR